jgi:acylpyruvate hydrolase
LHKESQQESSQKSQQKIGPRLALRIAPKVTTELATGDTMNHTPTTTIQNIWAVGRNYGEHAKELGNATPSAQSEPMIFLKAGSSVVFSGGTFRLPTFSQNIHHEIEVAFRFGGDFQFDALTIAIDLTARDTQDRAKAQGLPWSLAKTFRDSALLGPATVVSRDLDLQAIKFQLKINGEARQQGTTHDMIHSVEKLRCFVTEHCPVVPGDWLLTGTPGGVGPVHSGDVLEAEIPGLVRATWKAALPK